jgi:hypothetical protein
VIVTEYTKRAIARRRIEKKRPFIYGCHSLVAPDNRKHEAVRLPKYSRAWPYLFTRTCQYDNRQNDSKCIGCKELKNGEA